WGGDLAGPKSCGWDLAGSDDQRKYCSSMGGIAFAAVLRRRSVRDLLQLLVAALARCDVPRLRLCRHLRAAGEGAGSTATAHWCESGHRVRTAACSERVR